MLKEFGLLTNLARVNLIAGKNGVGKTKLLESLAVIHYDEKFSISSGHLVPRFTTRIEIFISCFHRTYSIALIEEIENGIHYSEYEDIWERIYSAAKKHNIQVFATTYSQDMIYAAHKILGADLMYYRLDKDDVSNGIEVANYSPRILEASINSDFEIR